MKKRRNRLDFPDSGLSCVNPNKTCPRCGHRHKTVQVTQLNVRGYAVAATVECYGCEIGFTWTYGPKD